MFGGHPQGVYSPPSSYGSPSPSPMLSHQALASSTMHPSLLQQHPLAMTSAGHPDAVSPGAALHLQQARGMIGYPAMSSAAGYPGSHAAMGMGMGGGGAGRPRLLTSAGHPGMSPMIPGSHGMGGSVVPHPGLSSSGWPSVPGTDPMAAASMNGMLGQSVAGMPYSSSSVSGSPYPGHPRQRVRSFTQDPTMRLSNGYDPQVYGAQHPMYSSLPGGDHVLDMDRSTGQSITKQSVAISTIHFMAHQALLSSFAFCSVQLATSWDTIIQPCVHQVQL